MITKKTILNEDGGYRMVTRQIVRDIITIYKNHYDGEFYLPEEIDEEKIEYDFSDVKISVELLLNADQSIGDYKINGSIWKDEDVITITLMYNPEVKEKILYDLIGSLNEVVSHELQHYKQQKSGSFDLYSQDEPEDPYEYYTQPHEIDAQVAGFKRMSKITKRPFEVLVRNWFKTHRDIHQIPDGKVEDVISLILKNRI